MATNGVLPLAISLVIFSVIFTIAYRQIDDRYKVGPYIQFLRSLDGVKLWVFWLPPAMSIGLFIAMALGVFETKNQDLDEQRISSNASPTGYGPPPAKSPPPTTTASPTPTAESAQALRDRLAAEEAATHNATQICPGTAAALSPGVPVFTSAEAGCAEKSTA
ncbi:uncharacterized protein L3040_000298 [Drepanopeziza brunnea f. sp. 'multigermtubi']|uniref:Uncharacterized protein n=1 Tax=Marssonina brunnea f. sp. multigermtubi (strain MB_m1) TaxID=1072389 RepID=K1WHE2_MARBU|nr:uncharacterized protein MBM_09552 [Drepanopeziza brunnea f. sp. 'multigermtubi' MB_m1]EKD12231.1 hypothetical protein MBM_09552 [Drepanopeziza brunnea f. sp. 'multigermtubi' MB_m1]KAJ5054012.1 hypothetical protein L3040_000298 [Drepanopeziza brunnea f. sp. 'multigermtubi']